MPWVQRYGETAMTSIRKIRRQHQQRYKKRFIACQARRGLECPQCKGLKEYHVTGKDNHDGTFDAIKMICWLCTGIESPSLRRSLTYRVSSLQVLSQGREAVNS